MLKQRPRRYTKHTNVLLVISITTALCVGYVVFRLIHLSVLHARFVYVTPVSDSVTTTPIPTAVPPVHVPILMYHYVEVPTDSKDTIRRGLDILPSTFEVQITTLLAHGYTPIFMSDLARYFDGKTVLPEKPIILTFDDGYRDFYTDAYPILRKHNVKATSYVISGFLGGRNYMTTSQVQEIAASGLVEIAAHTVHHPNMKGLSVQALTDEVSRSRMELEKLTGKSIIDFAYPYGAYDEKAIHAVSVAGFHTAVITKPGDYLRKDDRFVLPRLRPGARVGEALIEWLKAEMKKTS
jgi:peptidoglycan/xylan/chitin deacetylase (PgdA/CDA1 family)